MVKQILRITQDTFFKLRPEQANQLKPDELSPVAAGTTFEIQSYAYANINGSFDGNIKVALKDITIRGLNTWFVYSGHAQVEFDDVVVYPLEDQETLPVLHVNRDTVFKRKPLDSSLLESADLYSVTQGQSFRLHSYAFADSTGDFNSHVKFAFRYQEDYIRGLSTWFAYDRHVYVEFDGDVVYPTEDPQMPILRITEDTVFKRRPVASSELSPNERYTVQKGSTWKLESYAYADSQGSFNAHIKFSLKYEKDNINGFNTWYVYDRHARVEIQGKVVYPIPKPTEPPPPAFNGIPFKLPGNTSTFYTDQPIIPNGSFTWGEATKNARRIPDKVAIVDNIIALARELERARSQIGRPFVVNSWYRPPAINAAVGGVSNSQHLYGKAADLRIPGYSGRRVANALMLWWPGGVGIYSNMPDIVHLDVGPKRTWGF